MSTSLNHLNPMCCGGAFDTGTPKGTIDTWADCQVYIAKPSTMKYPDSIVVVAPDVFGVKLINNKIICDKFAETLGCTCILAEYFQGNGMDTRMLEITGRKNSELSWWGWFGKYAELTAFISFTAIPWFIGHNYGKTMPIFVKLLKHLRQDKGFKHVFSTGYCFGGGINAILGSSVDSDLVDAYAIVHPGGYKMENVQNFKKPVYWIFSEIDASCNEQTRKEIEETLKKKEFKTKTKYYAGSEHGFAIRGDARNPKVAEMRNDCFHEVMNFFKENLQQ